MPFGSGQFEFSEVLQLQKSLCEEQLSSPLDRLMSEKLQLVNLANRTFGFNGWSYNITKQEIDYVIFDDAHKVAACCFLKVTLKDGTFREDFGYGTAEAANKGEAMERARRIALSKALKETLKAFGIIFQNFDVESERSSIHLQNPVSNFYNRNQNGQFVSGHCNNSSTSDGEEQNIPLQCSQLLASSSKKRQRNQFLEKTPVSNESKRFKTTLIFDHSEKPLNKSGGFEETSAYKQSSALAVEAHIPEQTSLAVDEVSLEENGNENYNARLRSRKHLQNELVHFTDAEVTSNLEYASETGPTLLMIKVEQEEDPTSISDPIPANKEVEIDNSPSELLSVKKYEILTSKRNRRKNKRLDLF